MCWNCLFYFFKTSKKASPCLLKFPPSAKIFWGPGFSNWGQSGGFIKTLQVLMPWCMPVAGQKVSRCCFFSIFLYFYNYVVNCLEPHFQPVWKWMEMVISNHFYVKKWVLGSSSHRNNHEKNGLPSGCPVVWVLMVWISGILGFSRFEGPQAPIYQ